jgi:hypothetical protein
MSEISHTNIFLLFIILIIVISVGYCSSKQNNQTEGFTTNQSTSKLPNDVLVILNTITDNSAITNIQSHLLSLQSLLSRYNDLDAPIIIDDNGNICNMWNDYNNGKYTASKNASQIVDNSGLYKCLNSNGELSKCNNIYADGFITQKNTIPIENLLLNTLNNINSNLGNIEIKVVNMNKDADFLINRYGDLKTIEINQQDLIKNNMANMEDKKRLMNENKNKMGKQQLETSNNQINFSQIRDNINNNESWNNIYYRIVIGLVITLIILGILNFLFSDVL